VLQAGLETAEYVHTDDAATGQNGYCTVIGNDLFAYFSSTESKVGTTICGCCVGIRTSYSMSIPQLFNRTATPPTHLAKLQFSSASLGQNEAEWQAYRNRHHESQQGVKLVTEALLWGVPLNMGLSPVDHSQ